MASLERTLRLYPWWCLLQGGLFWQPVFVLWFSSHLPPADVLRLEALYFGAVVVLEVPSGMLADRIGRKPLLVASSLGWGLGAVAMAMATDAKLLAIGQLLLALGMALGSGADSALHADSLYALGREEELGRREARARSFSMVGLALSGCIGGLVGTLDLRATYALSALAGLAAASLALALVEPPATTSERGSPPWQLLRDPVVRWVLLASVSMVVVVHAPYELLQPWLALALGADWTPPLAGALVGASMGLGALAASRADRLAQSLGVGTTVVGALVAQALVLLAMGLGQHPAWLPVVALRSVGNAVAGPVLLAAVHPRLRSDQRATWLSVQSLAGRLGFSASLLLVAAGTESAWTSATMWSVASPYLALAALASGVLWLTRPRALRRA